MCRAQRIFIRNATGSFSPGDFPWRYSFCGYTLVPKNPTAMVIEDALEDARCATCAPAWRQGGTFVGSELNRCCFTARA